MTTGMWVDTLIAWWNLENLFERSNDPNRDPELQKTLKKDLKGWTAAVRDKKIANLAKIIEKMFNGKGPDLLGVCEIENESVLGLLTKKINLPNRTYSVLSHKSPDARGIDVSFLFDPNVITPSNPKHQVIIKRTATRDLFWATMTIKATGRQFIAIANRDWRRRVTGPVHLAVLSAYRKLAVASLAVVNGFSRQKLGPR